VSICENESVIESFSFNLGASRLQQRFLGPSAPKNFDPMETLRIDIRKTLKSDLQKEKRLPIHTVIGSSGTIKACHRLLKYSGEKVHPFHESSLKALVEQMTPLTENELLSLPGMEEKRVDIILAGAVLLHEIMRVLGAQDVYTTPYAMRDGVLSEEMDRFKRALSGALRSSKR
jgi:exopolyphosphatase / guanosine-5'-triphosphate,3'-diphosphate pyrophosphatase